MGVNLKRFVKPTPLKLADLNGKVLAVDAYNIIYQFLTSIRQPDGTPLKDSEGRITSHLSGLFYRNINLMRQGIELAYVFDGEPPSFKKILSEREERKKLAEKKYEQALQEGDVTRARVYAQQATRMNQQVIIESKQLLEAMGVCVIQAPSEGEAQAARLNQEGKVFAVVSQDYDSLLFGAEKLIRYLNVTGKKKVPGTTQWARVEPEIISLQQTLKSNDLTREQLIIIALLTGTDYNPGGVKGVGPATALKLVKEHKTLNKILEHVKWEHEVPAEELLEWFLKPKTSEVSVVFPKFNPNKVKELLLSHDFSENRVTSGLNKLKELNKDNQQQALSDYF